MHEIPWSSTFSHEILLPHQVGKQIMFRSAPLFQARLQLSFFQNRESWARSPTESWGEFRGHRNMVNYFIHSFPIYIYICLVVWNIGTWILFFHIYIYILGISSSQLTCIFFRGVETTNQVGSRLCKTGCAWSLWKSDCCGSWFWVCGLMHHQLYVLSKHWMKTTGNQQIGATTTLVSLDLPRTNPLIDSAWFC